MAGKMITRRHGAYCSMLAAMPGRVGAVGSFHGGGLVTANPNSPHLQAATSKAQFLVAIAANDDARSPKEKDVLKDMESHAWTTFKIAK